MTTLPIEPIDLTYDNTDPSNHQDRYDEDDFASYGPVTGLLETCLECGASSDDDHSPDCLAVA